jgi:hypothetical protein
MYRTALLYSVLLIAPAALTAQQPTVPHDSVRGAIRAIDMRARPLDVSAGVGYALRVVRLQLPARATITDRAGGDAHPDSIALAQLKLGDVVRAQFGGQAAPFVIYTLERVGTMAAGVKSTP